MTVAALDVGGTKVAAALVTYEAPGEPPVVSRRFSVPTNAARGGDAVLQVVCDATEQLISSAGASVLGIGIGAAGVIDPRTGNVRYANDIMPSWSGQPLKTRLQEQFGLPVAVMGDVHAHALGEARWGTARGAQSCLCVGAGTGLGGAYVLDGKVVSGFRGAAGHVGHTLHPRAAGLPCACGGEAHAETVASGTAIAARYQGKPFGAELDPQLMGGVVAQRASEGDLEALEVMEFAGRALGEAVGSWCNVLDPELVVLSGSVTKAGVFWRRALDEGFKSQVMPPLADTPLLYAALGDDAPLVGAAENLMDQETTS